MAQEGEVLWSECNVPVDKADDARDFYKELLGWEILDGPAPGGQGRYIVGKVGDKMAAGIFPMDGPQFEGLPSHWMTYIKVDDVDASVEKAVALGGAVKGSVMDIPTVGRIAMVADSVGAVIGLIQPAD